MFFMRSYRVYKGKFSSSFSILLLFLQTEFYAFQFEIEYSSLSPDILLSLNSLRLFPVKFRTNEFFLNSYNASAISWLYSFSLNLWSYTFAIDTIPTLPWIQRSTDISTALYWNHTIKTNSLLNNNPPNPSLFHEIRITSHPRCTNKAKKAIPIQEQIDIIYWASRKVYTNNFRS